MTSNAPEGMYAGMLKIGYTKHDVEKRVAQQYPTLRPGGKPIPGLYAAGVDISGVDSGDYSVGLSGHAFGFALTGGRIAAEEKLK